MFTYRQELIINKLLHSINPLSLQLLSHELEMSERTIRKDISEINLTLSSYNLSISHKRKEGYFIEMSNRRDIKQLILNNEKYNNYLPENSYQRKLYILFKLLWSEDYISLNSISEEIFISKTTAYNDFQNINDDINSNFNIKLKISKTKGYKLNCTEDIKRKILSKIITEHKRRYKYLMKMFTKYDIYYYEQYKTLMDIIYSWSKDNSILISSMDLINLTLEIQICYRRFCDGFKIDGIFNNKNTYKFPINQINSIMRVNIPDMEIQYILEILNNKPFILNYNPQTFNNSREITQEFIYYISNTLENKIFFNETEVIGLENYISFLLTSLSKNSHYNTFSELDVKKEYKFYYSLSQNIQPIISKYYNFQLSKGDFENLALYLVIMIKYKKNISNVLIISDYTNILLSLFIKKFEHIFGESVKIIDFIDTKTFIKNYNKYDFDYIISTNLINANLPVKISYVNINLSENDIFNLVHLFKL